MTYVCIAEAISCLLRAIEIYTDMGRFLMAAKCHETIAELYESNLADLDKAVKHYQYAADCYKGLLTLSAGGYESSLI